ncbi:MAG: hypothetical protein M3R70_00410 [Actinomycetota bacterium]|nr:hypothetical protein [Actinomycetota bacterium]
MGGATSNQTVIRQVNDVVAAGFDRGELMELLCECGRTGCTRLVPVLRDDFDAVREQAGRFIVVPEHELGQSEVIAHRAGFAIVGPS